MRYLGIDYGTGKVGIALSDEAGTMGFPKGSYRNDARLFDSVVALAQAEKVTAVVIGDSRDLSGVENPVAQEAQAFGRELQRVLNVPVYYEFEAFSTQEARRAPDGARTMGAQDAAAAALILTSYLSRQKGNEALG
ncbi:MAG: Holliday junction resolvase RuvX [Minisyncoccia bacterium]